MLVGSCPHSPMQRCFSDLICLNTGDILRHRRLSLFGHVARLDPGITAHDALRLMVDTYEGRKTMTSWRRPPGRPRNVWLNKVQEDTNALLLSIRCGDLRSPGVMERRNGPLGLRDDDHDDEGSHWPFCPPTNRIDKSTMSTRRCTACSHSSKDMSTDMS